MRLANNPAVVITSAICFIIKEKHKQLMQKFALFIYLFIYGLII